MKIAIIGTGHVGQALAAALRYADNVVWSMNALPRDKHVMPWRIEDELRALGANYVQAGRWRGCAIRDGNLLTGQQNFSGSETAHALVRALGE